MKGENSLWTYLRVEGFKSTIWIHVLDDVTQDCIHFFFLNFTRGARTMKQREYDVYFPATAMSELYPQLHLNSYQPGFYFTNEKLYISG